MRTGFVETPLSASMLNTLMVPQYLTLGSTEVHIQSLDIEHHGTHSYITVRAQYKN